MIDYDSNQELGFSGFSPTVIISQADVARTNAIQVGSRIDYRLLMAGDPDSIQTYQKDFKKIVKPGVDTEAEEQQFEEQNSLRLRNASESNTRLMKPIANLDTFCSWQIF